MDKITLFYLLATLGSILLIAIIYMSRALVHTLSAESDIAGKKFKAEGEGPGKALTAILVFLLPFSISAQAEMPESSSFVPNDTLLWSMAVLDSVLLLLLMYMRNLMETVLRMDPRYKVYMDKKAASLAKKKKVSLVQVLQGGVPIEEEASVMTDHEYDGIHELDNALPPWWKYGFYLSIVFAFVYLINYHLMGSPLQIEEYTNSIEQGEQEVQAYLASQSMNVDETSVERMLDAADLQAGLGTFKQYCVACHKEDGGGSVGPNLTDIYWIHGGDIKDIFKTIKYGANNGMKSWKDELNPVQMQQVASYIMSLGGTNPVDPKEPEGEEHTPAISSPSDSTMTEEQGLEL